MQHSLQHRCIMVCSDASLLQFDMTITDIAEPTTRDVELGTEVDEQQQDTEVKEKSFFESYADWFVGLVDGNEEDEASAAEVETEQYQNEYLNDNADDEEVGVDITPREVSSSRVSSSPSSRVQVSSIPPRPQLSRRGWQEEWSFGYINQCPMILKPFACLIQLLLFIAVSAVYTVCFFGMTLIMFFFGGVSMYQATYAAKESNKLMKKYKNEGVNVDGYVERIWSDWEHVVQVILLTLF